VPTLVGCVIPDALANDTRAIVARLRADDTQVPSKDIIAIIYRMTEVSLEANFLEPTKAFGAGQTLIKMVELTITSSLKATRYGLKKVIPKLNPQQKQQLADFLEESMHHIDP